MSLTSFFNQETCILPEFTFKYKIALLRQSTKHIFKPNPVNIHKKHTALMDESKDLCAHK